MTNIEYYEPEYEPIISQEDVVALLGRSLSESETQNFNIYLEITELKLKDLLCIDKWPNPLPTDLKMLLAKVFGSIKATQDFERDNGVTSKRVEDFAVNFSENKSSPLSVVLTSEAATVSKYNNCSTGIMHGETLI